jgi:hypothetical protein
MSFHHPTISAWTRTHEGPYEAEIAGHKLKVVWSPNVDGTRGSFHWEASFEGRDGLSDDHHYEEMEEAMGAAELFAERHAAVRAAQIARAAEE